MGCGIAFVLVEIGLSLFGISYPSFFIADDLTGYAHKPGAEGLYSNEGEAYIRINSMGLRDREHTLEKPLGTFRIALLGDSYTEAMQVPTEQIYAARLEHELSDCPSLAGRQVEAINFGVSGFSTAQELLVLRHNASLYDPDLVLLALYTENDIRGNLRALYGKNNIPYFIMNEGRLVLDNSFHHTTEFRLQQFPLSAEAFEVSRVLQVFRHAKYKLKSFLEEMAQQQQMKDWEDPALRLDLLVYLDQPDPSWEHAWKITERLIVQMKREVDEGGRRFLVVSLSNPNQVHPDVQHRQALVRQLGVPDLLYPDRRIQALAKRENIELLSLAEPLATYAEQHGVFLHGFQNSELGKGHWNAAGHRLAGKLMSERICVMVESTVPAKDIQAE
ncbi:SGNH/GDSL hydrolase family protein [Nitrospira sp.]